jgi:hypothetical protein
MVVVEGLHTHQNVSTKHHTEAPSARPTAFAAGNFIYQTPRKDRMSIETIEPTTEKDSRAAKSKLRPETGPLQAGIVAPAHKRRMYSPYVVRPGGLDRPGQAGPDPGNFLQDNNGPIVTNVRVVPMFWGSAWNDDKNPNPTVLQVYATLVAIGMDSFAYHLWQTAPSNGWDY